MKNLLMAVFLAALCGCSIFPRGPDFQVSSFDLGVPAGDLNFGKCSLDTGDFQGETPSHQKMVFRSGINRLLMDEYNRWSEIPPEMVKSFLNRAFAARPAEAGAKKLLVEGDLFQFEGNLDRMTADVQVELTVLELPGRTVVMKKIYSESVPFEKKDSAMFAAAMSSGVRKITEKFAADISKISQ
jgi:ABC-type uncharacterized transport system auxiliary subunit